MSRRYLWLLAGTAVSLLAVQGRWDVPAAAWVYPALLLVFSRGAAAVPGTLGIWASSTAAMAFWLVNAEQSNPLVLALAVPLGSAQAVPYLVDRLVAPRLADRPRTAWAVTLVFPLAKVAVEFAIASATPFGVLYGVLGATQSGNLPLIQVASVTGVYGVSFLVAWAASVAALVWARRGAGPGPRRTAAVCAAVLLAVLAAGGARLALLPSTGPTVRVAGVSASRAAWEEMAGGLAAFGSVPEMAAAGPERMRAVFGPVNDDLIASTEREAAAGARLVVWAESAGLTMGDDAGHLLDRVREVARRHGVYVQSALTVYTGAEPYVRNQTVLVGPDGAVEWTYDKAHPVPVLEPYRAGDGVVPVHDGPFGRLSGIICYDADFPDLSRQAGAQGVDVMLVSANTWAGIAELHARGALFRSVENGFAMVRQANRGVSVSYDPLGRTLARVDYFRTDRQTMVAEVPTRGVRTVYGAVGDVFAWLCVAATAALAAAAARRRGAAPSAAAPERIGACG
ncbi:nitrilase-related carbon-nitrogen hydrolase [Allonocardiopsis opalescens]|uniref:Apolipoprotein N-acyltransferase n=1 Tax=Allonocardiopsis opalescens TaxID=1144618 RepID=A0A2T0PTB7_9ACTN|nr:nitrilase-related carbon-nitrogen hydrolase [Allonocardiopsis opalescens]PRX92142.1 apolipoprotein N-acyltransferase [Allonocardiopsis opalescens]